MTRVPLRLRFVLPLASALLPFVCSRAARADDEEDAGCVACHSDKTQDPQARQPALDFANDAHRAARLTCTSCHGGKDGTSDYVEAHDAKAGFRGKFSAAAVVDLCGGCHDDPGKMTALVGSKIQVTHPGERFRRSVHAHVDAVQGFEQPSCVSCHGPHGILPPSEPASKVNPTRVPDTCGRCHGDLVYMRAFTSAQVRVDQEIEYRTSVHGQRLSKGDTKVAVCSSCHGNHEILAASDPGSAVYPTNVAKTCGACHADAARMKGYEIPSRGGGTVPIPTDQVERWRKSVHHEALAVKGDLSAPTCNDCHGNHGATPPEVRAVASMCGQCHSRNRELFAASPLKVELDREGRAGCTTCHSDHEVVHPSDALLAGIAQGRTASGWEPGPPWRRLASSLLGSIQRLERKIDDARRLVDRVADYGMDMTEARRHLREAGDRLVQARVTVHAFDAEKMSGLLEGTEDEEGGIALSDKAAAIANGGLEERAFRRVGLVVALIFIGILIAVLVVKIRRMEAQGDVHSA